MSAHPVLIVAVVLQVLLAAGCGSQPENPEASAVEPEVDPTIEVLRADRTLLDALARNDAAAVDGLLDADFEWTDAQGRLRTKAESAAALASLAADLQDESERQSYHWGNVHVVTSAREGARMMRVWAKRPDGWRTVVVISTALATGTTPFAAAGAPAAADCENPCRSMPFTPGSDAQAAMAKTFQQLKVDEWHPNPENWAPYVLDDVYYVTATARLSKADRVEHLRKLKETGAPSVPGDPVTSMRILEYGDSAVMFADHTPFRGGKPYHSVRVWAFRGGRWQLANTQQTVMAEAQAVPPVTGS